MANQLQQLVKNTGETEKKLGSINETLVKIYGVEQKQIKLANDTLADKKKTNKREEQQKKKTLADKLKPEVKEQKKKEKKEEKKGLLETIGSALKGILSPLVGVLGSLGTMLSSALAGLTFTGLAPVLAAALGAGILKLIWDNRAKIGKWWKEQDVNKTSADLFQGLVLPNAGSELKEMRSRTWSEATTQMPLPWQEGYGDMEHKKVTGGKMIDLLGEEQSLRKEIKELEKKIMMPDLELEQHKPFWFIGDVASYRDSLVKDKQKKDTKVSKIGVEINKLTPEIQKLYPGMEIEQRQRGGMSGVRGMIPTMVESGEALIPRDHPNAAMGLMMNSLIPRFNEGGEVSETPKQKGIIQNVTDAVKPVVQMGSEAEGTEAGAIGTFLNMGQGFASMISTVFDGLGFNDMFKDMFGGMSELMGIKGAQLNDKRVDHGPVEPLSGSEKEIATKMYNYLTIDKGVSRNKALGILANIKHESGFRPGVASGDDGGSGGLFQMKGGRGVAMEKAVPDWRTNWKGQIDHALQTDRSPEYLSKTFSSGGDAADWFMRNWERPAESLRDWREVEQNKWIEASGLQNGGVIGAQTGGGIGNISTVPSQLNSRLSNATEKFANQIAAAQGGPTVIVQDEPPTTITTTGTMDQTAPDLTDGTSVPAATNYMFYDLNYGPVS